MSTSDGRETKLLLHNIRSVQNVGAIFRTAEAIGISEIILTGYTPTPFDRFGRARSDFSKTALGAEQLVSWRSVKNIGNVLKSLKREGYFLVGVEQYPASVHYRDLALPRKSVIVLGNEVRGISPRLLQKCNAVVEIPMHGKKESLNVSVAAGVVLYGLLDRGC